MSYATIKEGSTGETVKVWQLVLGAPVKVDGIFGPITKAATVQWQRAHDLEGTGIVGPETWDMMSKTGKERVGLPSDKKSNALSMFIGGTIATILGLAGFVASKFIVKKG